MSALAVSISICTITLAALAAYFFAERQGRDPRTWAAVSVFLSPVALLVLLFMPPLGEPKKRRWFAIPLAVVASISVALAIGLGIWSIVQTQSFSGFPQCGSAIAHDTAKRAFAEAPMGKLTGLTIVAFRNDQEISSTDTVKQCTADVTLNNGVERPADYRIELRGTQYLVFVQVR